MATFKTVLLSHQMKKDGTINIKIRVTHNRKSKFIATTFFVTKNDLTRTFKLKNQYYIEECDKLILKYRSHCNKLGERLRNLDINHLIELLLHGDDDHFELDFIEYGRSFANKLRKQGREGNAQTYDDALNNLVKFVGRDHIRINEITGNFIRDWIEWIQNMPARPGRKKGTRAASLYPSNVRALHNRIKDEYNDEDQGIIRVPLSPFSKIKLPKFVPSRKRALTADQIKAIFNLDDVAAPKNKVSRTNLSKDVFILSFGLIGMNAVDLFNCTEYKDGRITYERTKTKNRRTDRALISIKVEDEIKSLLDKYRDPAGERVFCFYHMYKSVSTFSAALNKGLKNVGERIGVENLEFYAARHSWATIAINDVEIDKFTVHTAMNHVDDTMKVTDIYIRKSWEPMDKANRNIFNYLNV